MAIVHPRELAFTLSECTFAYDPGTTLALHGKGVAGTVSRIREPLWRASIVAIPPNAVAREAMLSWLDTQDGALNAFLTYDRAVSRPLAYPNGVPAIIAGTWNGSATVTSLATPGQIALSGVPAGFQCLPGDRISLVQGGTRYGYHRISEAAAAGGGGTLTVAVKPLVQDGIFTTAAVAVLYRPLAKFRVIPSSISYRVTANPSEISFQAGQVL